MLHRTKHADDLCVLRALQADNLCEKLTVDLSRVPPEVFRYIRKLGFLTGKVAYDWGVGCCRLFCAARMSE